MLFIFTLKGSVFPKGAAWGVPSACLAILVNLFQEVDGKNISSSLNMLWSGYSFVLGFLIVFRTQQAYSRFWEGTTLLQKVRATWFNAVSSLFAFCTTKKDRLGDVECFQQLMVRLVSLLFFSALQQVGDLKDESFEILDQRGLQSSSLEFLQECGDMKIDVIIQWIQKLIVLNMENGLLPAPPPVCSRVFQELSNGVVDLSNAQKLTDILFPFPYAQMVTTMLLMATIITPIIAGTVIESLFWSGILSFVWVFSFWSINYIAAEIELPFGDDANDLPIAELMKGMNRSLQLLLYPQAQIPPSFVFKPNHRACTIVRCANVAPEVLFAAENVIHRSYTDMQIPRKSTGKTPNKAARRKSKRDTLPATSFLPVARAQKSVAESWAQLQSPAGLEGISEEDKAVDLEAPTSIAQAGKNSFTWSAHCIGWDEERVFGASHRKPEKIPEQLCSSVDLVEATPESHVQAPRAADKLRHVKDQPEVLSLGAKQRAQLRKEAKDLSNTMMNIEPKIAACLQGIEALLAQVVSELEVISTVGVRLTESKNAVDEGEPHGNQSWQAADFGPCYERFEKPHQAAEPDPDLNMAVRL